MSEDNSQIAQVKKSLAALPCFDDIVIEAITPFPSGLSHKVFKVNCFDRKQGTNYHLVAKLLDGHKTGAKEASVTTYMTKFQLAPDVVFSNKQWIITQYLPGVALANANLSIQQKLELSTKLLSKLYRCDNNEELIGLQSFDPIPYVISLIQASRFSQSIKANLLTMVNEHSVDMSRLDKVVIHGDANFNNFIFDEAEKSLQIIDFEASSYSTREYDIAMLFAVNCIPTRTMHLVQKDGTIFSKISMVTVTRYLVISCLINALWYFEQFNETGLMIYKINALKTLHYVDTETQGKYLVIKEMR